MRITSSAAAAEECGPGLLLLCNPLAKRIGAVAAARNSGRGKDQVFDRKKKNISFRWKGENR